MIYIENLSNIIYLPLWIDIIQDLAAKGLSLVHANSTQEERNSLVSSILEQFMQGRRTVQQVTSDTKLFEEGQLGKSPSG